MAASSLFRFCCSGSRAGLLSALSERNSPSVQMRTVSIGMVGRIRHRVKLGVGRHACDSVTMFQSRRQERPPDVKYIFYAEAQLAWLQETRYSRCQELCGAAGESLLLGQAGGEPRSDQQILGLAWSKSVKFKTFKAVLTTPHPGASNGLGYATK